MQFQMRYQLVRAFGRVLGLGWSQTNDNVFTGSPAPTYQQALHWPLMHPIDVICGPYTYQCLPEPFTLRADDLSGLALLYPIGQGQAKAGQVDTLDGATRVGGHINFPTGRGVEGVEVTGRRLIQFRPDTDVEKWQSVSSVSGSLYTRVSPNGVMGVDTSLGASMGTTYGYYEGWHEFTRVPMLPGNWMKVVIETEPVNPMYVGAYSVGPYTANTVRPSGEGVFDRAGLFGSYGNNNGADYAVQGAASSCGSSTQSEAAPLGVTQEGSWTGQLCTRGQTDWSSLTVKGNRSLTVEVTAEDESGSASSAKALPVIGVWRSTDALGSAPGDAAREALNGRSSGMTLLTMLVSSAGSLRIGIADQRGDGRPDFNYGARVLYADTVSPASVPAGGGVVTIRGMGFRAGNVVTVNGVMATVQSWSATTIVATVPASRALVAGTAAP